MSIVTKTGDQGLTGLMFNRRVSKSHPRVEAYGSVDELTAALGLARSAAESGYPAAELLDIQKDLVVLMGELATCPEDRERYFAQGFGCVSASMTRKLEDRARDLEAKGQNYTGWAIPGDNKVSASLDFARAVCRRSERRLCALQESGELHNSEMVIFLNRLSDLLWLMARHAGR